MGRTPLFDAFARAMRIARFCERESISTAQGLQHASQPTRRRFLAQAGGLAAAAAVTPGVLATGAGPDIAIVGAGLAGLACGDTLLANGIAATLYEAGTRAGGRQWSLHDLFPGQVTERGGEFIDNLHKTMISYARRFGLTLEDVTKEPGEVFYRFNGQSWPESVVVDEYRAFVATMRGDLRALSNGPTAFSHNAADVALDNTSLLDYLNGANSTGRPAGPVARAAIIAAYEAEFGLLAEHQSALNFILFIHADRRSKFTPFGVFSDERWHVVEGNDRIAKGLADGLAGQIQYAMRLVRVRAVGGRIELTFKQGNKTVTRTHDAAVIAIPFSVLRGIDLDASLGLPPEKRNAINTLGIATNAKMMVGFSSRPWVALGATGASYSDLAHHQTTWESNPSAATATRGILMDYASGLRGETLNPARPQTEAAAFLGDLDKVFPGTAAAATRVKGKYVVHLEHWPSNPLSKGSYTCYTPGQFTTVAGHEGTPVGNLHFAGEHTDSFYNWQGYMEGGCLSGIRAAREILA
jgi:monoamine oxidase